MSNNEALKATALAATPGPWFAMEDDWSDGEDSLITCESREGMIAIAKIGGGGSESGYDDPFKSEQQANAAFFAVANPAAVLELLAALEESNQRAGRLNGMLDNSMRATKSAEQREEHLKADAAVMGQRIAELERANSAQDNHINQLQDRIDTLEKRNGELGKYAGKLEQRLQQPIDQDAHQGCSDSMLFQL